MRGLVILRMGALLLACSAQVVAQIGPDPAKPDTTEQQAEAPLVLQPISVTGYHTKRIDTEGPEPVVIVHRADLEQAGITTLEEFARYLPLNWPEPLLQFGAIGAAAFNLRGLGIDATLTLVNGLRIAPYAQSAENYIDINAIPVSAIDRIEVLKDGASAIYGADAVAGVVNIILRDGYEGIEASAGYGRSSEGDGEERLADVVMGKYSARGNLLLSLAWYDREAQPMAARDWSSDFDFSSAGGPNWRNTYGSPPTILWPDQITTESDPACGTDPLVSSIRVRANGSTVCGFNGAHYQDQFGALERLGASLSGRFEIKPGTTLFGNVLYSDREGEAKQPPQAILSSPFMPTDSGAPFVPADHPGNPFGTEGELFSRVLSAGRRTHLNDASAYRAVLGLDGSWSDWEWQIIGLVSGSRVTKTFKNLVFRSRYQQALLGMGGADGNQWYNPFGFEPDNDPALIDWLTTDAVQRDESGERSIELLANHSFGMLLGGRIAVAVGLHYREQDLDQWADDNLLSGDLSHTHEPVTADRENRAVFIEFNLPVLDELEAQLAWRYEDYSDFGSTSNPKIALRWQPLNALLFRASWGTSFKPPSFFELYQPRQQGGWWYFDAERCEWTGLEEDCGDTFYPLQWGGNPNLDPEEGTSWFAGTVWTPGFLPGFGIELDFWDFQHENRIEWLDAQTVLDNKGDFGVTRAPPGPDGTPGRIIGILETQVNADELHTRGFDTTLRYAWQTATAGDFQASLMHSYIDLWVYTDSLGNGPVSQDFAGLHRGIAIPRNRANFNLSWNLGPHGGAANAHYTGHYRNHTNLYVNGQSTGQPMTISSHTTVDLQYSYTFEQLKGAVLRLGCNNVADKDPPLNYGVLEPFHDGRGRFFYIRWQQPIR